MAAARRIIGDFVPFRVVGPVRGETPPRSVERGVEHSERVADVAGKVDVVGAEHHGGRAADRLNRSRSAHSTLGLMVSSKKYRRLERSHTVRYSVLYTVPTVL